MVTVLRRERTGRTVPCLSHRTVVVVVAESDHQSSSCGPVMFLSAHFVPAGRDLCLSTLVLLVCPVSTCQRALEVAVSPEAPAVGRPVGPGGG